MTDWRAPAPRRRAAVLSIALLLHGMAVIVLLAARVTLERPSDATALTATIVAAAPPRAAMPAALPPARVTPTRLRALARAAVVPQTIRAPLLEAQAASAAAPPPTPAPVASAASEPLRLTLTREQLRAIIAGSKPTLAQSLARPPAPSALARLGGDDAAYEEVPRPGGVTEVHVHGGCLRMVPTPRSQYDPFNHGGERLTAACTDPH